MSHKLVRDNSVYTFERFAELRDGDAIQIKGDPWRRVIGDPIEQPDGTHTIDTYLMDDDEIARMEYQVSAKRQETT